MDEPKPTKVYKVTLCVVDRDGIGIGSVIDALQDAPYPNRCIVPSVMDMEERTVGWHDTHPLNLAGEDSAEFARLFGPVIQLGDGVTDPLVVANERIAQLEQSLRDVEGWLRRFSRAAGEFEASMQLDVGGETEPAPVPAPSAGVLDATAASRHADVMHAIERLHDKVDGLETALNRRDK
jgi:hypothetical protein